LDLIYRENAANCPNALIETGSIRCLHTSIIFSGKLRDEKFRDINPEIGNHPSFIPNKIIHKRASQNVGIANPTNTNIVDILSKRESWYTEETIPIGKAKIKTMIRDKTFIETVIGIRSAILSITFLPSGENEYPKSKKAILFSHRRYWIYNGLSNPYKALSLSFTSGVAFGFICIKRSAGEPGARFITKKHINVIPNIRGNMERSLFNRYCNIS